MGTVQFVVIDTSPERWGLVDELDAHLVRAAGVHVSDPHDTARDSVDGQFMANAESASHGIRPGRQQERTVSIDDGRDGIHRRTMSGCEADGDTGKDARTATVVEWLHVHGFGSVRRRD